MKKIMILLSLCVLLSGCGNTSNNQEIESLREEIKSLQAENNDLKNQLSEATAQTTETTETSEETTTTEAETTSAMTAEEIQSYIAIGVAGVSKINSADGVNVAVYWRNNSDKEIKYITFNLEILNAVGDVVANQITKKTLFPCRLTGPVSPIQEKIDSVLEGNYQGINLYAPNEDGKWDYVSKTLPEKPEIDHSKVMSRSEWETIMYNPTAHSVNIVSVNIEYMDGTTMDIGRDLIEYAFIDY